ncbi:EcKinase domain containing protein, partial [Asbolus verrucosus]
VYPLFKKFERHHGICEDVEYVPKCLKVSIEEHSEMLALENLKVSGFEVFDKTCFLDHDHISLIFLTYGRFHASSFALRDQQPEEYEKLVGRFSNVYEKLINDETDFYKKLLRTHVTRVMIDCLIPGEDDEIINKFHKYENDGICRIFEEVVTDSSDYPAILHGDCWSNNMINLDYYLKIYYKSFSSFLKKLGSEPEKLFPFEALKEHWKKYAKFGMIMALNILQIKMTDKNDFVDFSDRADSEISDTPPNVKFDESI